MGKMTEEAIEWLKANYRSKTPIECAEFLNVHISSVYKYRKMLRLEENAASQAEKGQRGYCLDCQDYIIGGFCSRNGKPIGALNQKLCFKPKIQ